MAISKKYHEDPEYREKVKDVARKWYHANKKRALARMTKYNQDNAERIAEQKKNKYNLTAVHVKGVVCGEE